MDGLLGPGARSPAARPIAGATARLVWDFVLRGYGPGGGWKLVDDELLRAGAAIRDLPSAEPAFAPYRRLAAGMALVGDQTASALLLASGTVKALADQPPRRIAAALEGLHLARRQGTATLQSIATREPGALEAATGIPDALRHRVARLVVQGHVDLDRVDVQARDVPGPTWSDGLLLEVRPKQARGARRIALVQSIDVAKPRTEARLRLRSPTTAPDEIAPLRQAIKEAGIQLLVCTKGISEDLETRLAQDGVAVVSDAPKDLVHRIEMATGAHLAVDLRRLAPDDVGQGTLTRDGDLHVLTGNGPSATLCVPAGPDQAARIESARRWLRLLAAPPETVRDWQEALARSIRDASDHAPGASPLAMKAVADVLDRMADAVVRNLGGDPQTGPHHGPPEPLEAVAAAWRHGIDVAMQILRVDARYDKRPSDATSLRGGTGPIGSPKGMPGDIPPLM